MKKTIGIFAACMVLASAAHAAGQLNDNTAAAAMQPDKTAITADSVAEKAEAEKADGKKEAEPVKNAQNVKTAPQDDPKDDTVQQVQKKEPRVIRKTVKIAPKQENWYLTKPADFTYYVSRTQPEYSLAIPAAFGADLLEGLPAEGSMLVRGASDTTVMSFNAAPSAGVKWADVFKAALTGKKLLPPPSPVTKLSRQNGEDIIEITEFEAPPQYSYQQVDTAPLELPSQLENLVLTEAGEYKTFQGVNSQYMQFTCTSAGTACILRLTLTEYSGYQYTGLYLFPQNGRLKFIPLSTYSARSLQCGSKSYFDNY